MADPAHREQQDRAGDRDEDVVEAGQQPEMLLVHHRRLPPRGDEGAQLLGLIGAQRARRDGSVEIAFAVHGYVPPVRSRIAFVC